MAVIVGYYNNRKKINNGNSAEFVLLPPSFIRILHHFFQFSCFDLDITSFCIANRKASHKLALVLPFKLFFFLYCRNCGTKEAIVCIAFCVIKYLCI